MKEIFTHCATLFPLTHLLGSRRVAKWFINMYMIIIWCEQFGAIVGVRDHHWILAVLKRTVRRAQTSKAFCHFSSSRSSHLLTWKSLLTSLTLDFTASLLQATTNFSELSALSSGEYIIKQILEIFLPSPAIHSRSITAHLKSWTWKISKIKWRFHIPRVVLWHRLLELFKSFGSLTALFNLNTVFVLISFVDNVSILSLHSELLEFFPNSVSNIEARLHGVS